MPINPHLLDKARAAGAELAESERRMTLARAEYHALVRRLHLAGASLRDIAAALDLSHQRVQQMVDGAGGSWWRRIWRSRNARRNLVCTFCDRPDSQVKQLIAGPAVFICDACSGLAGRSGSGGFAPAPAGAKCSFCRKRKTNDRPVTASRGGKICGECLQVCRQILVDSVT